MEIPVSKKFKGKLCAYYAKRKCALQIARRFHHYSRKCRRNQLEPPCADPYARWCGRGRRATAAPMPI